MMRFLFAAIVATAPITAMADPVERIDRAQEVWANSDLALGGITFAQDSASQMFVEWSCETCTEGTKVVLLAAQERRDDMVQAATNFAGHCSFEDCIVEATNFEGVPMVMKRGIKRDDLLIVQATLFMPGEFMAINVESTNLTLAEQILQDAIALFAPIALEEF